MILAFIDETSDDKQTDYLGLTCTVINSAHYRDIKRRLQDILVKMNWDKDVEFKGSYLFSASRGCENISIEERVAIASEILRLNRGKANAKMNFTYLRTKIKTDIKSAYLEALPKLLSKALKSADKRNGKDLLLLSCDERNDLCGKDIIQVVYDIINKKGYTLLEDIVKAKSCFETAGIIYSDIVGYLVARIDTISNDKDLFDSVKPEDWETNGKLRKLKTSKDLVRLIKNFKVVIMK